MYVHICTFIYIYTHIYIDVYIYLYIYVHVYIYKCAHTRTQIHKHTHTQEERRECPHTGLGASGPKRHENALYQKIAHARIYIQHISHHCTYIHIYIHIYMYIYVQGERRQGPHKSVGASGQKRHETTLYQNTADALH